MAHFPVHYVRNELLRGGFVKSVVHQVFECFPIRHASVLAFVVREKHRLACRLGISLPEIDIGQFLCFRSFALGRFRLAFCRFRFFLRLAQFFFRFALLGFRLFTRRLFKVRLTRPQAFQFSFLRLLR